MCTRGHDDLVALFLGKAIHAENAALGLRTGRGRLIAATRFGALLLDQFVGCKIGKIVERLDPGFAQRDQHRFGQIGHLGQIVFNAQFLAAIAGSFFAFFETFDGTPLAYGKPDFLNPGFVAFGRR